MTIALFLALGVAVGLGFASYFLSKPGLMTEAFRRSSSREGFPVQSAEFIFFSILAFLYLMWATVPLSIGGGKQFDAGRMLMYPISLRKLFAIDFLSELTALQSVFAIPAILAMSIGAGLATGNLTKTLIAAVPTIIFGIAMSKWLSTTVGSLVQRKRARGETIVALVGALAGIGGALAGQLGPLLIRHADSFRSLRWTPPGAASYMLASTNDPLGYTLSLVTLYAYAGILIFLTYLVARRAALGLGGQRKRKKLIDTVETAAYTGWQLPLVSDQLSAIIEKECRYAMRNAQIKMMAMMPLILIVIRLVQSQRVRTGMRAGSQASKQFLTWSSGWMATGGVLYVFLLLAGLSCNLFAFEEGGMRTLILAPIQRRKILLAKNLVVTTIAATFATTLLLVNGLVFRDLTLGTLLFAGLSFVIFASIVAIIGNWFSIRFPKRMQFGKRLNVSGIAGLLLIPMIVLMASLPLAATLAGYYWQSLAVEYFVLSAAAVLTLLLYFVLVDFQGRSLERRERDILEAVKEPTD